MNIEEPTTTWQAKIFPVFTLLGWALIGLSFALGAFVLAPTAASYWGGSAKVTRDAAEIGSALLAQLVAITATPRWLEPLTFVGLGSFIFGIALAFSTIPRLLANRGRLMAATFPLIAQTGDDS